MKKYARKYTLIMMIFTVLLLSACGNSNSTNIAPSASPAASESPSATSVALSVTDDYDHPLEIESPERILAPYMEDALVTLGVTPVAKYAAAGTVQEHLEPWLADLPTIELMGGLSPEAALSFEPDLIMISSHFLPIESYETIAKIAPTYLFNGETSDWRAQLRKVAELLGKEDVADQKLTEYEAKISDTKEQLSKSAEGKSIAIVWPAEKELYLVGSDFLSGKLLYGELGLQAHELSKVTPDNFGSISFEKIPELDADELFIITPEGQTKEQVRVLLGSLPLWATLPAVKNNRVHHVSSGHWINSAYMANLAVVEDVTKALLP
ncbi:ABC transporter substrate-binding protein [Paenibacillus sinopodophylli]|uniref:ABC transporter substrate-binding protein n=1 Tax=Paenibacillus sinopodophylli TaxID=1837342 RepID=UPI001486FCA1|nr:ABC transporter substrate-binding protein [Paenibacillus sinopodophylli]